MYKAYPKITLKINKIITDLHLTEIEEDPQDFIRKEKRFYRTACKTENGERVFFKCILIKDRKTKNSFLNEINFLKTINNYPGHPLFPYIPAILDFSAKLSFPFLIYKLLPGESRTRESRFSGEEIKRIAELLKIINSSSADIFSFRPRKFPSDAYLYKRGLKVFLKNIQNKELEKRIDEFVSRNSRTINSIKKKTLSHGDFSEVNLIFFGENIKLVDWEHVSLRNPLYDFADFWVKRRNYPEEEEILINEYFQSFQEKNYFLKFFKLALLEICLRDISLMQKIIGDFTRKKSLAGVEAVKREKDDYCAIVEKYILSDKEKIYSFKDI